VENAYADGRVFEWFSRFRRDPHPKRVRFSTDRYRYNQAYWVRLDLLTPGEPARIDAAFTDADRLTVTTSGVDAFTLLLSSHPSRRPGQPLEVDVDGGKVTAPAGETASFLRRDGVWSAEEYKAPASAKRPGLEGPMSEAFAGRHVYVFGTAGEPTPEELDIRRRVAEEAANWSVYRGPFWGRVMVFPRVAADSDVRPSDLEEANLVLFGTRETNSLIERFADRLPMHLDDGGTDLGLAYLFPVGDRYVLINSGLPWWKSAAASSVFRQGIAAAGLADPHDYRLYRRDAEEPLARGRFDRDWLLSPEDAERLLATGAVKIRKSAIASRQQ